MLCGSVISNLTFMLRCRITERELYVTDYNMLALWIFIWISRPAGIMKSYIIGQGRANGTAT